jgi:hypothetical protein
MKFSFFSWFKGEKAADVAPPPPPKAKKSGALPTYVTSARTTETAFLPETDLNLATSDASVERLSARNTKDLIRRKSKSNPDLSSAVFSAIRMAVSANYTIIARNLDGTVNAEGTRLAQQLARRIDYMGQAKGWNHYPTLRSASEAMGRDLLVTGACCGEIILNQARLPDGFQPYASTTIKFRYKNGRKVPFQVIGDNEVSLDIPTFFYVSLDQDLLEPYSDPPMQAALQPVQASTDFQQDLRRVFRRAISPRLQAKIKYSEWLKQVPADVLHDREKLDNYMSSFIQSIRDLLDGLEPEDALVSFDIVDFDYITGGNTSLSQEYEVFSDILNSKQAAGVKALPTVLGHSVGSQNIASTESMLYLKTVEGAVQSKLGEIYSRIFTTAVRLFGIDAVVEFRYEPIALRPDIELEAFRAMKQSRVLELLSLGLISDEEASIILSGSLPEPGAPRLSGTGFTVSKPDTSNPTSNTANGQGSALNQTLKPNTPTGVKSKNQSK